MLILSSFLIVRRWDIIRKLCKRGAVTPESAVTFREAKVLFPAAFKFYTINMLEAGVLRKSGKRFYIDITKKDVKVSTKKR